MTQPTAQESQQLESHDIQHSAETSGVFSGSFKSLSRWVNERKIEESTLTNNRQFGERIADLMVDDLDADARNRVETFRAYETLLDKNQVMDSSQSQVLSQLNANDSLTADQQVLQTALTSLSEYSNYDSRSGMPDISTHQRTMPSGEELAMLNASRDSARAAMPITTSEYELYSVVKSDNLYGCGKSGLELLRHFDYDQGKINLQAVKDFVNKPNPYTNFNVDYQALTHRLSVVALTISRLRDEARNMNDNMRQLRNVRKENAEIMPTQKVTRQVKRHLRKIRFGLEREFAKHPNQGMLALGASIIGLGWVLTSDNAKIIRGMLSAGSMAVLGGVALNFASGAVLGKPLLTTIEEATRMGAPDVPDNMRNLFFDNTTGATKAEKERELSDMALTFGVIENQPFGEVWEKYQNAKTGGKKSIHFDGINENGIFSGGRKSSEVFYHSIMIFERRYGDELKSITDSNGGLPCALMPLNLVLLELMSADKRSENKTHPFQWLMNRFGVGLDFVFAGGAKLGQWTADHISSMVGNDRGLENYIERMFPEDIYEDVIIRDGLIFMPGGAQIPFKRDPETKAITLINIYDNTLSISLPINDSPKEDVEKFIKQYILSVDRDQNKNNPVAQLPKDAKIEWNQRAKKWFFISSASETNMRKIGQFPEVAESAISALINFTGQQNQDSNQGITLSISSIYADNGLETFKNFAELNNHSAEIDFKNHLRKKFKVPLMPNEFDIRNWEELIIKDSNVAVVECIMRSDPKVSFKVSGTASEPKVEWLHDGDKDKDKEIAEAIIRSRIAKLKELPKKLNERWATPLFPLRAPWRYLKPAVQGGTVNEDYLNKALQTKEDLLIERIQSGSLKLEDLESELSDFAIMFEELAIKIQNDQEIDSNDFKAMFEQMAVMNVPKGARPAFEYFTKKMVRYSELNDAMISQLMETADSVVNSDSTLKNALNNDKPDENAVEFVEYTLQRIMNELDSLGGRAIFGSMSEKQVNDLCNRVKSGTDMSFPRYTDFNSGINKYGVARDLTLSLTNWHDKADILGNVFLRKHRRVDPGFEIPADINFDTSSVGSFLESLLNGVGQIMSDPSPLYRIPKMLGVLPEDIINMIEFPHPFASISKFHSIASKKGNEFIDGIIDGSITEENFDTFFLNVEENKRLSFKGSVKTLQEHIETIKNSNEPKLPQAFELMITNVWTYDANLYNETAGIQVGEGGTLTEAQSQVVAESNEAAQIAIGNSRMAKLDYATDDNGEFIDSKLGELVIPLVIYNSETGIKSKIFDATTATGIDIAMFDKYRKAIALTESNGLQYNGRGIGKASSMLGMYQFSPLRQNSTYENVAKRLKLNPIPHYTDFLASKEMQEKFFQMLFVMEYESLSSIDRFKNSTPNEKMAIMAGSHLIGSPSMIKLLNNERPSSTANDTTDGQGTTAVSYMNYMLYVMGERSNFYRLENSSTKYELKKDASFVDAFPGFEVEPKSLTELSELLLKNASGSRLSTGVFLEITTTTNDQQISLDIDEDDSTNPFGKITLSGSAYTLSYRPLQIKRDSTDPSPFEPVTITGTGLEILNIVRNLEKSVVIKSNLEKFTESQITFAGTSTMQGVQNGFGTEPKKHGGKSNLSEVSSAVYDLPNSSNGVLVLNGGWSEMNVSDFSAKKNEVITSIKELIILAKSKGQKVVFLTLQKQGWPSGTNKDTFYAAIDEVNKSIIENSSIDIVIDVNSLYPNDNQWTGAGAGSVGHISNYAKIQNLLKSLLL